MEEKQLIFEVVYRGRPLKVARHHIGNQVIFQVQFADGRRPLMLTRATNANAARFWTCIPEGRQREAEEIGPLISEFIQNHQE